MALRDILVKFGIDVEGAKQLDDVEGKVKKTLGVVDRLSNSIQRLGYWMVAGYLMRGVKNLVAGQFEAAVALKYHAEALGITTEELQKYQYVAEQTHTPVQQVAIALRYFNRTIGEAALGTKSANKTFAALGMNVKGADGQIRPTSDLLVEFSDKLKKVPSQALRTAYAMRTLGRGGASMLPVLEKGGDELKSIFKDIDELGGGFTDAFIEKSADLDRQLKRLKMGWRSIYVAIASEVIPVFRWLTDKAIGVAKIVIDLAHHTYAFRTALMALGGGATIYAIKKLLDVFNPFKMSVGQLMMTLLSNAPLIIFIGLIGLLYLAIDDLYTFMKGGDSVIGAFLDKIGGKDEVLRVWTELHGVFNKISDALAPIIPMLEDVAKKTFEWAVNSIPSIIKWGGTFATYIVGVIDTAITGLRSLAALMVGVVVAGKDYITGDFKGGDKALDAAFAKISELTGNLGDRIDNVYRPTADAFQSIGEPPPLPKGATESLDDFFGGGGGQGSTPQAQRPINVTIHQTVNGGDPNAVKDATAKGARQGIKSAASGRRDAHANVTAGMPTTGM